MPKPSRFSTACSPNNETLRTLYAPLYRILRRRIDAGRHALRRLVADVDVGRGKLRPRGIGRATDRPWPRLRNTSRAHASQLPADGVDRPQRARPLADHRRVRALFVATVWHCRSAARHLAKIVAQLTLIGTETLGIAALVSLFVAW